MNTALFAALLCAPLAAAPRVEPVAPVSLSAPLTPSPALAQLRLDLAALQAPAGGGALPAALSPHAFAGLSAIAQPPGAPSASPVGAAAAAAASAPTSAQPIDAVRRVALAQQLLGQFKPGEFEKLPAGEQQAALDDLWDHWKARGLVADSAAAGMRGSEPTLRAFDALISRGVDDKALTAANKSVFLGVGVLGYPLEDALWLSRTRIRDAIDDNTLSYPRGQRWKTADGTPEFLGTTDEAQRLVDAWGRAVEYGRQVLAQAAKGSRQLPRSDEIRPEAAAGLAAIALELRRRGDDAALRYLRDEDPTFLAFLLDARKPGYYLYNGDGSAVARVMSTDAAQAMGIRRLEHGAGGAVVASTYFYRPARVAERLREAAAAPASADAAAMRDRLRPYADEAQRLSRSLPPTAPETAGWTFVDPETLTASALTSPANKLSAYPALKTFSHYDLPITAGTLRTLRAEGRRYGALDEPRWRSLLAVYDACPALQSAPAQTSLRVVSQPYQTQGLAIAPAKAPERGATVQLALLDRLAALDASDPAGRDALLRFAGAAVEAALGEGR